MLVRQHSHHILSPKNRERLTGSAGGYRPAKVNLAPSPIALAPARRTGISMESASAASATEGADAAGADAAAEGADAAAGSTDAAAEGADAAAGCAGALASADTDVFATGDERLAAER